LGRGFENLDTIAFAVLAGSVHILNDVLPPEFQIRDGGAYYGGTLGEGDIVVAALPPHEIQNTCGINAVACAEPNVLPGATFTRDAVVLIPNDFGASDIGFAESTVVHELLHALGIQGHVDHIQFPDSLMGAAGELFPNPGFVIRNIDREVLQIMYMSQRPQVYNAWDEWSDTTLHVTARAEDGSVHFGTALFNGLPQPWAKGRYPDSYLADNRGLSGTVSWYGILLGFSGVSPIGGAVILDVELARLDTPQDLKFRDLYFLNKSSSNDPDRWFPTRNLDYEVDITGNTFVHSSIQGHIAGNFMGERHEAMAGTIKRTDLVGAFGGTQ